VIAAIAAKLACHGGRRLDDDSRELLAAALLLTLKEMIMDQLKVRATKASM
jgi:hypothetical protein